MRRVHVLFTSLAICLLVSQTGLAQAPAQGEAPPAPPPPDPKALRALRLRFEREPTVAEVQAEALKFFKVHPEKVASYQAGATWKALMPDVEVTFNNEMANNDRLLKDIQYRNFDYREDEKTTHGAISIGVRAHWALDRLIFNAETLDVSSLVGVQEGLLREITSLYFTRRRLVTTNTLSPAQDPNEAITEELRLAEITANLDALTGGYFSKAVDRKLNGPKEEAGN
jgi:hypothetical protein